MVKAVVDVRRDIMLIDTDMHADQEAELLDLTLADPRWRQAKHRLREIARAREVVVDFFAGFNQYGSTSTSLRKYFDAYAFAARRS